MASEDRIRELEDKYEGFKVYDNSGSKIGKVDDLFIDESDREEYVGVKMGLFGLKSTLIPMDIIRVNEADKTLEVSESKDRVKEAPNFDDDEDITPDFEDRIRGHFGLSSQGSSSDRGSYGAYSGAAAGGATGVSGHTETDDTRDQDQGATPGGGSGRREGDSGERGISSQSYSSRGDTGEDSGTDTRSGTSGGEASSGERGEGSDTEGAGDRFGAPVAESGQKESRDSEEMRTADTSEDSGGGTSGSGEASSGGDPKTREMPVNRETTETETYQEGGRTKIRRRVRREEVEFVDDDQNR